MQPASTSFSVHRWLASFSKRICFTGEHQKVIKTGYHNYNPAKPVTTSKTFGGRVQENWVKNASFPEGDCTTIQSILEVKENGTRVRRTSTLCSIQRPKNNVLLIFEENHAVSFLILVSLTFLTPDEERKKRRATILLLNMEKWREEIKQAKDFIQPMLPQEAIFFMWKFFLKINKLLEWSLPYCAISTAKRLTLWCKEAGSEIR